MCRDEARRDRGWQRSGLPGAYLRVTGRRSLGGASPGVDAGCMGSGSDDGDVGFTGYSERAAFLRFASLRLRLTLGFS